MYRAAPESYIAELFPHRPPMAIAETQIIILKVIVGAPFFSSCYFKVQKLHSVALRSRSEVKLNKLHSYIYIDITIYLYIYCI